MKLSDRECKCCGGTFNIPATSPVDLCPVCFNSLRFQTGQNKVAICRVHDKEHVVGEKAVGEIIAKGLQ